MAEPSASRPFRAQLAVAAIFALGVVFGIALSFALLHHVIPMGPRAPREGPMPIERMARELDLDAEQREKLHALLEKGHGDVRHVLDDTGREIRALLRPDQQEKFDRMRPRSPFGHGGHDGAPRHAP